MADISMSSIQECLAHQCSLGDMAMDPCPEDKQAGKMHASTLPMEILLQIFRCLDARSFFAARKTCKWWYQAAQEPVTLHRLLQRLPVTPSLSGVELTPREVHVLSAEASHQLMLDVHAREATVEEQTNLTCGVHTAIAAVAAAAIGLPTATSHAAPRMAVLAGRSVRVFDTAGEDAKLLNEISLDERIRSGLWLRSRPPGTGTIALSSKGDLLAVGYINTVQIYDLSAPSKPCVLNDNILSGTGGRQYITALRFEHNDYLIRVQLDFKGAIIYVGSPSDGNNDVSIASFDHWASSRGLANQFLDSAHTVTGLTTDGVQRYRLRDRPWVEGLQLLHPLKDGCIFVAQRRGGRDSARYTLMHARYRVDSETQTRSLIGATTVELARLESFLSSQDYWGSKGLPAHWDPLIGGWREMPSAQESGMRFAVTPDSSMLLLTEHARHRTLPAPDTQVFVYRLPIAERVAKILERESKKPQLPSLPITSRYLDWGNRTERTEVISQPRKPSVVEEKTLSLTEKFTFPAIPLCLGTLKGRVVGMSAERVEGRGPLYRFEVHTDEARQAWTLESA